MLKKCVNLVINTNCTEMHGQKNIKFRPCSFLIAFMRLTGSLRVSSPVWSPK